VSRFLYKTNTTFNTNIRRLQLTIMVGINNIGHIFPMAFMFIISELAKSFQFANKCLTNLYFYNYPQPNLIYSDFLKGLGAAVVK
jgi:hypothetical protein